MYVAALVKNKISFSFTGFTCIPLVTEEHLLRLFSIIVNAPVLTQDLLMMVINA